MKKFIFCLVLLLLLLIAGFTWYWLEKQSEPLPFREVQVTRGDLEISVLATGVVEPENRLELKPPIAGRVESILVQEGQKVNQGQVLAWLSSSERAALLDAARAKGPQELAHWEDLFRPTPLLAPLNGLIIVKNVVPGQVVTAADSVLVMSDHLIVNCQVDETDIGQIHLGQEASLTLDAYPQQSIPGRVTRIAFESKTVNNVTIYEVEVLPEHVPEFMRSGMTANLKATVERRSQALLLAAEAIRYEGRQAVAFVPDPQEPRAALTREVRVGLSDGKNTEILAGLQEGERVWIPEAAKKSAAGASSPFSPFGGGRPRGGR